MAEPQKKMGFLGRIAMTIFFAIVGAYVLAYLADRSGYDTEAAKASAFATFLVQYHASKGD